MLYFVSMRDLLDHGCIYSRAGLSIRDLTPTRLAPMAKFQAPRGTRDLLPAEMATWRRLEDLARDLANLYGFQPIDTPMFEDVAVFERGIGEVTDIVEKELFRVRSPGTEDDSWALRPEATAGMARAYVAARDADAPAAGSPDDVRNDVPIRPSAGRPVPAVLAVERGGDRRRGTCDRRRDRGARPALRPRRGSCRRGGAPQLDRRCRVPPGLHHRVGRSTWASSSRRFPTSSAAAWPSTRSACWIRKTLASTLSSTTPRPSTITSAPIAGITSTRSLEHLDMLGVSVIRAPRLVRGLDYYTRTAFELYKRGAEGQQSALGGGGRYDGLLELFGARPTPGIGFALGIDRIALAAAPRSRLVRLRRSAGTRWP